MVMGDHPASESGLVPQMGQSSNVYAVAMMADGKVLFSTKEIKVTLGGCGG